MQEERLKTLSEISNETNLTQKEERIPKLKESYLEKVNDKKDVVFTFKHISISLCFIGYCASSIPYQSYAIISSIIF